MSLLKKLFGKDRASVEVSFNTFAILPLFQWMEGKQPFDDWRALDVPIPEGLDELFEGSARMYQMYIFYMLTADRYGYEIADRAIQVQGERLSKISTEMADQLKAGIGQIHRIVLGQVENPALIELDGETVEMPVEYSIALQFLTMSDDSPFHVATEDAASGDYPDLGDADVSLTEHLGHARDSAAAYFGPMVKEARVVL